MSAHIHGRHNVSRKSINQSILMRGVFSPSDVTSYNKSF